MSFASNKFEAPLDLGVDKVRPEWIDYNGHMNVAYYVLAFDYATDRLYARIGLGKEYMDSTQCSTFTLESHINYLREVRQDDPIKFSGQLLDFDTKRIHWYCEMHQTDEGYHAASIEFITLHVNMQIRRSTPFLQGTLETLKNLQSTHVCLPKPEFSGRKISIKKEKSNQ